MKTYKEFIKLFEAAMLRPDWRIAFENAYEKNPDIVLHKEYDGSHPSLLGTYLAACVVFSSITHKSPLQIKYDYFGKIAEDDKKFLQKVAKNTVEDFYKIKL